MARLRDIVIIAGFIIGGIYVWSTHETDADRQAESNRKLITDLYNQMEP